MGVHNLWELLAPVGRRVSVETLTGKKLAIDASIWIVQFMKAMRDEKGEMVRNAHLIGFFRRICKLLFLRTKPVFVFDGGTPALKRRTVIARRRQRENAQSKIRKTAEKLLLNQLRTMKLKQLAEEIKQQRVENDGKGKKVLVDQTDVSKDVSEKNDTVLGRFNQEKLDEMLAASLAAEEDGSFAGKASTSSAGIPLEEEEEEDDEDEEMILPTMQGKIDPAVLAALPPSVQLDLLVQMRERLMAENRQKYQKVKKAPSKFSELQIQSYLKTVAFRREIDQVRKSASGRGVGGVQASRIASESNREFIFSSSFTGDKEALASAGAERNGNMQPQTQSECPPGSLDSAASTVKASRTTGSIGDESRGVLEEDVETYMDDRGHLRFSRVRAMGIRMTRDLQRNLDMIKEMEQDTSNSNSMATSTASVINDNVSFPCEDQLLGASNDAVINDMNQQFIPEFGASIEISFEDGDDDDDLFARLVAGNPVTISSVDNNFLRKQSPTSNSESDWEDGFVENIVSSLPNDVKAEIKPSSNISNESEVEWEEGVCDGCKSASPCPVEYSKSISKGQREEETEMQEAIRRSLEDLQGKKCVETSSESDNRERFREMAHEYPRLKLQSVDFPQQNEPNSGTLAGDDKQEDIIKTSVQMTIDASGSQLAHAYFLPILQSNDFVQQNELSYEALTGNDKEEDLIDRSVQMTTDAPERLLASPVISNHDNMAASLVGKSFERFPVSGAVNLQEETPELFLSSKKLADVSSKVCNSVFGNVPDAELVDRCKFGFEAGQETADAAVEEDSAEQTPINLVDEPKLAEEIDPNNISVEKEHSNAVKEDFTDHTPINLVDVPKLAEEIDPNNILVEKEHSNAVEKDFAEQTPFILADEPKLVEIFYPNNISVEKEHSNAKFTEASLEEEIFVLDQEFINLGDEQRRNERNAESVSNEMFAECQELLQMFGLPYIIAPMEAEAQCADMELANLVDGVVTDDSDVFLFGARSVYKNIFDDRKYVETYFMKDIEKELGLSRDKLIRMALLLGSDYTEGISGIGIVNAIEVVNAFPEEDGLNKFREWIESPDPNIFGKFHDKRGSISRRRGSSVNEIDASGSNVNVEAVSASEQSMNYIEEIRQIFMDKHRNVSKNWHIPASFPSEAVISAYASPQVDKSTEPFAWGKPDLSVLRKLCWEKFGWSGQKADDLLLPVLKEYNKHETQLRLEAFYTFNERFAKVRSKRITKAVKGITVKQTSESQEASGQTVSKTKRRRKQSNTKETVSLIQPEEEEIINKLTPSFEEKAQTHKRAVGRGSVRRSSGNKRSRGSGRNQQVIRGGRKGSHANIDSAKSSSSDGNSSDNEQEDYVENLEELREVRRSSRSRKSVSYKVDELEYDEADKASDKIYEKCAEVNASEKELSQDTCRDVLIETTQHNFVEDNCEIGTTFCMDEDEVGELSVGHNQDPLFESEYAKEYLKMGGGFCMEEDETEKAPAPFQQAYDPCLDSLDKNECVNHLAESVYDPKKPSNRPQDGAEASTVQNLDFPNATTNEIYEDRSNYGDQTSTTSGNALRAMPFLRKKRRKN